MSLKFTILGCGSSPGVPRVNGDWGACDPNEPKNTRLRCSLLVERSGPDGKTIVVIDTSPDFRQQMIRAKVSHLDGVLYTHSHADHVHGIDDLRGFALAQRRQIDVYSDDATFERLFEGFRYCFEQAEGSMYPAILKNHKMNSFAPVVITGKGGDIHALPVLLTHGPIHALGFRFSETGDFSDGGLCYCPDVNAIPDETVPYLQKLDTWIVDGLQPGGHVSHFSIGEAVEWIEKVKPRHGVLTHMNHPTDYATVSATLPETVVLAYDGMELEV